MMKDFRNIVSERNGSFQKNNAKSFYSNGFQSNQEIKWEYQQSYIQTGVLNQFKRKQVGK